ncbi:cytochrome P450 [Pseudorhodobacter sp.]|uniref:cytochrome P450 n=1 Tax=Pseudorhodobacter sp. TaxID=1934400 RepID=UPI002648ED51|nr:cytochrome P450 [Pseudorhodobacter sp.]MDN5786020.1 cytochrome P450 [Pseudorhodobacter sp.]
MTRAPGPKGNAVWGSLADFKADSLGFLASAVRDHGDIVRLRFGPVTAHLINRPEYVDHVLSRNGANYDKATRSARRIAATTGDSLLSANERAWQRHRRLIQPAFQPRCFDGIGPVIDDLLLPMLARWQRAGRVDIVAEMMQLVIATAIRVLFSSDVAPERISQPLEIILADTWRRIESAADASMLSPRFHRAEFTQAVAQIDAIVFDLISKRRAAAHRPDDVLTRLLAAHDGTKGEAQLSDKELRDAAITLLLAGHETTANAVAWAFIRTSGGGVQSDPALIFAEAIRLYPSIWVIERRAKRHDTIGSFEIPRGSSVLISPYLLHRHPDFWHEPEVFAPSRFVEGLPRPRDGYMPFGLGQHRCVGLHLANRIATHILERVFARFTLHLLPGQPLETIAGITLRHKAPVWMQVAPGTLTESGPATGGNQR